MKIFQAKNVMKFCNTADHPRRPRFPRQSDVPAPGGIAWPRSVQLHSTADQNPNCVRSVMC